MRSILNKGVECSFQALIDIENKIKNSKAEQDCKAILLDEKSSMNAKPEMKIFNNENKFNKKRHCKLNLYANWFFEKNLRFNFRRFP